MTTVVIYRVLPRDGKDGTEYGLERTYRSLVPPAPEGGPYLAQEGDVFFVDDVAVSRPTDPRMAAGVDLATSGANGLASR